MDEFSEPALPWFRPSQWELWQFPDRQTPAPPLGVLPLPGQEPWNTIQSAPAPPQAVAGPSWQAGDGSEDEGRALDLPEPVAPPFIPGLTGELVKACWDAAPYQVAEVAIASALSIMSLLCGRVYRHGTLGLSLYLLVLAQTSTGKSFGYSANDRLHNKLLQKLKEKLPPDYYKVETLNAMIIGEIGSAQGLAQQMAKSPSTLFHADEFVEHIKLMSKLNPPPHTAAIRAELLRLGHALIK